MQACGFIRYKENVVVICLLEEDDWVDGSVVTEVTILWMFGLQDYLE